MQRQLACADAAARDGRQQSLRMARARRDRRRRVRAAAAKLAASMRADERGHDAGNGAEAARRGACARHGDAGHQPARIGVARRGEDGRGRARLHDLAGVHDDDAVGDAGDDAEIVGDETSPMPNSRCSSASRCRICAWMVTSSAVVGSSAMISAGPHISAMAIMTRWRRPPESWCGYCLSRLAAAVMPTCSSSSMARSRACAARHALAVARAPPPADRRWCRPG